VFPLLLAIRSAGFSHSSSEEKKEWSMDPSTGVEFQKMIKEILGRVPVPVKKMNTVIQIL
jgi:hypothetical protein